MAGPPSPKRQRTDDNAPDKKELEKVKMVLESVQQVEEELDKVNVEQAKEILVIETKYNAKKRPTYIKRNELLTEIPQFWKKVFVNHPLVGNYLTKEDEMLMDYLQTFDVTFVGDDGSFRMEMVFKENPYFSPTKLWKQVKFSEDEEEVDVTASELTWQEKAQATEDPAKFAFFQWFVSTDGDQDVAEIIKEEIWKKPVEYFAMDEDDEDEEDEDEGEDEGEENEDDENEEDQEGEGEDEDEDAEDEEDKE